MHLYMLPLNHMFLALMFICKENKVKKKEEKNISEEKGGIARSYPCSNKVSTGVLGSDFKIAKCMEFLAAYRIRKVK